MNELYQRFQLHSSKCLGGIFLFIHLGAIFCVCFVPFCWWLRTALIFGILISLVIVTKAYVLRNGFGAVVEFGLRGDGVWYIKKHSKEVISVSFKTPIFVSNYLIIINFVMDAKNLKISVPIGKDVLALEDFRRLKMLLKTARF